MSRNAEREIFGQGLEELKNTSFVSEEFRDGNWAKRPWFCEGENDWLFEAGYSLPRCRELVRPLIRVFPAEVCRRLLRRPLDAALIFGLFEGHPGFLIPLLDVAADVTVLGRLEGDPILRRLRQRETFASAASELSLWADLVRSNLPVRREPGVLVGRTTRHPDFGVQVGAEYFYVEAAQLQESALERASRLLYEEVARCADLFQERTLQICTDEDFSHGLGAQVLQRLAPGDLLSEYRTRRFIESDVLPHVYHALARIRAADGAPGRYLIPHVGYVEVSTSGTASAEFQMLRRPELTEIAERVWRKILEEAQQLPPGKSRIARGIVAIDVGTQALIRPVAEAMNALLVARRLTADGERLSGLDGVLLRGRAARSTTGPHRVAQLLIPAGTAPSSDFLRLARAVGSRKSVGE